MNINSDLSITGRGQHSDGLTMHITFSLEKKSSKLVPVLLLQSTKHSSEQLAQLKLHVKFHFGNCRIQFNTIWGNAMQLSCIINASVPGRERQTDTHTPSFLKQGMGNFFFSFPYVIAEGLDLLHSYCTTSSYLGVDASGCSEAPRGKTSSQTHTQGAHWQL